MSHIRMSQRRSLHRRTLSLNGRTPNNDLRSLTRRRTHLRLLLLLLLLLLWITLLLLLNHVLSLDGTAKLMLLLNPLHLSVSLTRRPRRHSMRMSVWYYTLHHHRRRSTSTTNTTNRPISHFFRELLSGRRELWSRTPSRTHVRYPRRCLSSPCYHSHIRVTHHSAHIHIHRSTDNRACVHPSRTTRPPTRHRSTRRTQRRHRTLRMLLMLRRRTTSHPRPTRSITHNNSLRSKPRRRPAPRMLLLLLLLLLTSMRDLLTKLRMLTRRLSHHSHTRSRKLRLSHTEIRRVPYRWTFTCS